MRTTEILQGNRWELVAFEEIKAGDTFRLFEKDGTPVTDSGSRHKFYAISAACPVRDQDGNYQIECIGFTGHAPRSILKKEI